MPTPNLSLPYIAQGQAQKEVTHNDALNLLDAVVQLAVLDRDLATPPGSPTQGARYLVAASPTGAWAGHANHIAAWLDGAWRFFVPNIGWLAWVIDEGTILAWNGSAWVDAPGVISALQKLGILTTADTTNRLAVKADGALFSHDDVTPGTGNMRVTLNKSAAAKDASFTFQDAFSTRALFGLLGDDNFTIKVSADGSSFKTSIVIDKTTGHIGINCSPDSNNWLAINADGVLFNKDASGDMHLTINKSASGKDAGFTFQDNFSTRALFGLLGDDNFTLKVSPDASTFYTAWVIDRNNGNTGFEKPFGVNGGPAFTTIASDALTVTKSYIVPAPETGNTDNLATLNGGFDGCIVMFSGTAGKTITFKDGTGNLKTAGDFVMDNFDDTIMFVNRGGSWLELCRSNNG
jgi:hypothetical protein